MISLPESKKIWWNSDIAHFIPKILKMPPNVEQISELEMENFYKEVLKSNGITSPVSQVIINDSGLRGENMMSTTSYITIKFCDSSKPDLQLFMKALVPSAQIDVKGEEVSLFKKETSFFFDYLPFAEKLCKKMGQPDLLKMYPKCYFGDDKKMVFENLVLAKGYTLLDKIAQQDLEAATFALENLAKHHAISHGVIKECGGLEKFFQKFPMKDGKGGQLFEEFRPMLEPSMEKKISENIKLLERHGVDGWERGVERLSSKKGNSFGEIISTMKCSPDELQFLSHGDYWNNNMMFLKDGKGKIVDHKVIDLQATFYIPPCVDIGYYILTSVKPEVRRTKLRKLLQIYLNALMKTANALGCPIDLEIGELVKSFQKHFRYGWWFSFQMTTGPGMAVFKDMDPKEMKNPQEIFDKMDELTRKWEEEHPKESLEHAKKMVDYLKEYEMIENGIIY